MSSSWNKNDIIVTASHMVKEIKMLVKDSKELLELVCYMRKLLDECLHENSEGDLVTLTNDDKKLSRAFEIMMLVQHEKDLAKEVKLNQQQGLGVFK